MYVFTQQHMCATDSGSVKEMPMAGCGWVGEQDSNATACVKEKTDRQGERQAAETLGCNRITCDLPALHQMNLFIVRSSMGSEMEVILEGYSISFSFCSGLETKAERHPDF